MKIEDIHVGDRVMVVNKTYYEGKGLDAWKVNHNIDASHEIDEVYADLEDFKGTRMYMLTKAPLVVIGGNYFSPEDLEPWDENTLWHMQEIGNI